MNSNVFLFHNNTRKVLSKQNFDGFFEEEGTISFQINAFVIDKYILKNESYHMIQYLILKKKKG